MEELDGTQWPLPGEAPEPHAEASLPDDDWVPQGTAVKKTQSTQAAIDEREDYYDDHDDDDHFDDYAEYDRVEPGGSSGAYQPKKHVLAGIETRINMDMLGRERSMPNAVKGALKRHEVREEDRRDKTKDKSDRATNEQVLDDRTRLVIFKFIKSCYFSQINGCISTGKEANVYYCDNDHVAPDPNCKSNFPQLALKIFKTSILVFKDRDRYVTGEFRFRRGYSKSNPRKMVQIWAEKEYRNLIRLRKGGVRAPEPILVRSHLLLMEFLGTNGWPSPRLKDAQISTNRLAKCYRQLLYDMRLMYHSCKLVHADLSEYNILYHCKQLFIIDVSQSVEHDHPHAIEFLRSDCTNITRYFSNAGILTLRMRELFDFVVAIDFTFEDKSESESENLERLLEIAASRPPMTEEELMDENVFQNVFIPRTLGDVFDPEKEDLRSADSKHYLGVTGLLTGEEKTSSTKEGLEEDSENEDNEESDSEEGEDDESTVIRRIGFDPDSPTDAVRSAALLCVVGLEDFPEAVRLQIAHLVWDSREEPEWLKLYRRVHVLSKEEQKKERKLNKLRVKKEKSEARKTKLPKHVKQRQIKTTTTKKKKKK